MKAVAKSQISPPNRSEEGVRETVAGELSQKRSGLRWSQILASAREARSKGFDNEFAAVTAFWTIPLAPSPDICLQLPCHLLLQRISLYRRRRCSTPSVSALLHAHTLAPPRMTVMRSRKELSPRPMHRRWRYCIFLNAIDTLSVECNSRPRTQCPRNLPTELYSTRIPLRRIK